MNFELEAPTQQPTGEMTEMNLLVVARGFGRTELGKVRIDSTMTLKIGGSSTKSIATQTP